MTQQIDIDIKPNTGAAKAGVQEIGAEAKKTADSLRKVGKGAADIADAMKRVEQSMARIASVKRMLERELGKPVSDNDAERFSNNFDRLRSGRSMFSRRLRQFDGPDEWYHGFYKTFRSKNDADKHRRAVIQVGMQGTRYAQENPPPEPPSDEEPEPNRGGAGGFVSRAASSAMGFGKGLLALAGIGGIVGMAARASELNADESISTNTLRMRSGDLAMSFEKLRDSTRAATAGLGVTYVESSHLANEFARVAGTLKGGNLTSSLHSGMALSRAYGLDLSSGVDFMATMQRFGGTDGSDRGNRRLASMIADAISRSGYPAKADELIAAVASFATGSAAKTISDPNAMAYAGALANLTQIGGKYLGPGGAAALLGRADAAVRQGGAIGEPSMNFSYRAIQRRFGQIDPWSAEAIWQGGLFGTTRTLFGDGSKGHPFTPLGSMYRKNGWRTPRIGDETYLQILQGEFKREFADKRDPQVLDAARRMFGLSSMGEAAAFLQMDVSKLDPNKRQEILKKYQDAQDPGSAIRESVTRLDNELTRAGGGINNTLTGIRNLVGAIAQQVAPERYRQLQRANEERHTNFEKTYPKSRASASIPEKVIAGIMDDKGLARGAARQFSSDLKSGRADSLDYLIPYPDEIDKYLFPSEYQRAMSARNQVEKIMRRRGYGPDGNALAHKAHASKYGVHPAVEGFLRSIAGGLPGGFKEITAENDEFHHHVGYHTKHTDGLAADFTLRDGSKSAAAAQYLRDAAKRHGINMKVLDEYRHRSRRATGAHMHVQFNSAKDADDFAARYMPVPDGGHGHRQSEQRHRIIPEPATVHIHDKRSGDHIATVTVPFTPAGPAGSRDFIGSGFD